MSDDRWVVLQAKLDLLHLGKALMEDQRE